MADQQQIHHHQQQYMAAIAAAVAAGAASANAATTATAMPIGMQMPPTLPPQHLPHPQYSIPVMPLPPPPPPPSTAIAPVPATTSSSTTARIAIKKEQPGSTTPPSSSISNAKLSSELLLKTRRENHRAVLVPTHMRTVFLIHDFLFHQVERRRRDHINVGIEELARVVPGCQRSKGKILHRVRSLSTL